MKITAKILLINFLLVVIVSISITLLYHSTAARFLKNELHNSLLSSANNFAFLFEDFLEDMESEMSKILEADQSSSIPGSYSLDLVFVNNAKAGVPDKIFTSNEIKTGLKTNNIAQITNQNPNLILRVSKRGNSEIYYGSVISEKLLNEFSYKINSDIGYVVSNNLKIYSSKASNNKYFADILDVSNEISVNHNYIIKEEEVSEGSLFSTSITPKSILSPYGQASFLLFDIIEKPASFQSLMGDFLIVIIISGIALSLIFTFILTSGFREKIKKVNTAANFVKKGNLDYRIDSKGNDELSKLSSSFNGMLEELQRKNRKEKEYMEFISLINKNADLQRISEVSLKKIIEKTKMPIGLLYVVSNEKIELVSSYGIETDLITPVDEINTFSNVIRYKEKLEYFFEKDSPQLKSGSAKIDLKYLLLVPIEFDNKVIGVLELASNKITDNERAFYIEEVKDQLGVGLYNALSRQKLENYVAMLKELNDAYQAQNTEIKGKNEKLTQLHQQISNYAEELRKQKNQVEESSRMKTQFLANVTHEFKTPLNSIIGLTDLLMKKLNSPNMVERLSIIQRNSKKLLTIILNILDFAKLETDKIHLSIEEFELTTFLEEISKYIKPLADEKKLNFEIDFQKTQNAVLNTDRNKLEQIIINLLSNAIKFTEEGYVKLYINIDGENLILKVEDTGIGITQEDKPLVFEEFKQLDEGISRKYGGTGLGLTITKKYVELLGGSIDFESQLGKGVLFSVEIPGIVQEKSLEPHMPKLLLVTDDEKFPDSYSGYLQENDYLVDSISDNEGATQLTRQNHYEVIILDNNLEKLTWRILFNLSQISDVKPKLLPISLDYTDNSGYAVDLHDYFVAEDIRSFRSFVQRYEEEYKKEAKKILVLDDDEENGKIIGEAEGEQTKWTVQTEFNLEEVKNDSPNLIFVNLNLKYSNSFRVISELRRIREFNYKQIIGYIAKEVGDEAYQNLSDKLKALTYEKYYHIYDTFKVLRKKLNIKENVKVKEKLLFDEIEAAETSGSGKENVSNKILVVDDDSDTLFTVGDMIKELNYEAEFAEDGKSGINAVNNERPLLVLLDIMMPGMDGFETVRKIREVYDRDKLPVLALTAYAMIDDKEILERNGFNDLVTKPVKMVDLKNKIELFLAKQDELNYEQNISSGRSTG